VSFSQFGKPGFKLFPIENLPLLQIGHRKREILDGAKAIP
jgi:hypothetical protein